MMRFEDLPVGRKRLVELLGQRLGQDLPALGINAGEVTLRDSIRVWVIEDPAGGQPLVNQATATDIWHHQIWVDDKPRLWVRARARDEDWHVGEIVVSQVAHELERAFGELNKAGLDAGEVRYLSVPRRQLEAIWVMHPKGDRLIVLAAPASVRESLGENSASVEAVNLEFEATTDSVVLLGEVPEGVDAKTQDGFKVLTGEEFVNGIQSIPDLFGLRDASTGCR